MRFGGCFCQKEEGRVLVEYQIYNEYALTINECPHHTTLYGISSNVNKYYTKHTFFSDIEKLRVKNIRFFRILKNYE